MHLDDKNPVKVVATEPTTDDIGSQLPPYAVFTPEAADELVGDPAEFPSAPDSRD
jgi:hypothetical protein